MKRFLLGALGAVLIALALLWLAEEFHFRRLLQPRRLASLRNAGDTVSCSVGSSISQAIAVAAHMVEVGDGASQPQWRLVMPAAELETYRRACGSTAMQQQQHRRGVDRRRRELHLVERTSFVSGESINLSFEFFSGVACASTHPDRYWFDTVSAGATDALLDPQSTEAITFQSLDVGSSADASWGLDGNNTNAFPGKRTRTARVELHPFTSSVFFMDPEAVMSLYHLVADSMLAVLLWKDAAVASTAEMITGASDVLETIDPAEGPPRKTAVLMRYDAARDRHRKPCLECARMTRLVDTTAFSTSSKRHPSDKRQCVQPATTREEPVLVVDSGGGAEPPSNVHCFCDMLLIPRAALPLPKVAHRSKGYHLLHRAWRQVFPQSPKPLAPSRIDRLRLVIVQRQTTRRIGNLDAIVKTARSLSMYLPPVIVYMEGLSLEQQLASVQPADVLLLVHGMAMGWVHAMAMDRVDSWSDAVAAANTSRGLLCKHVIELQHRVRDFPAHYQFGTLIARDNAVGHTLVRAVGARYDSRFVRNATEEDAAMMDTSGSIQIVMMRNGFFHQQPLFDTEEIREALKHAAEDIERCRRRRTTIT